MVPIFNFGKLTETSATSESLFNDLKTNVFKHKTLPLRIDEFIGIHINSIVGAINLIGATITDSLKESNKIEIQNEDLLSTPINKLKE